MKNLLASTALVLAFAGPHQVSDHWPDWSRTLPDGATLGWALAAFGGVPGDEWWLWCAGRGTGVAPEFQHLLHRQRRRRAPGADG